MRIHRPLTALVLAALPALAAALPQSVENVAYPQEVYYSRDYRYYAPETLFDLLKHLPGVTLGWQSDGQQEIQLHGLDSRYLSILINGKPLLGASGSNLLATHQIPAIMVDHIEIDRNSRADLSMGGGAAGTINVVLNDSYASDGLVLSAGGETLSNRVALATHLSDDEQPLRLTAEQRLQRYETSGDTESGSVQGEWQAASRELSRNIHLNYNTLVNDRHPLQLYALWLHADRKDHSQGLYPLNRPSTGLAADLSDSNGERREERLSQRLGGNLQLNWSHLALETFFVAEQFDLDSSLSQTLPDSASQSGRIDDSRYILGWQLNETRNEHRWSMGLSMQQMKRVNGSLEDTILISNSDRSGLPYNYDFKENRVSAFLLDRWQLTPSTRFEAGMHIDSYEMSLDSGSGNDSGVATDTFWLPSFHLVHSLNSLRRVRISMSQSSREPGIADRIPYEFRQGTTIWRGNETLDSELISNVDIGYEQNFRRAASALSDRHSGFYLRLFQRIINDPVYQSVSTESDPLLGDMTVLMPVNSDGNAILRGLESDIEFYPGTRDIRIELGAALYRSQMQATENLPKRYQLTNQPEYMARLGFQHHPFPGFRYGGQWHLQGPSEQLLPTDGGYIAQRTSEMQSLSLFAEYVWQRGWYTLASINLTPGNTPWQEQQDIRQYRDTDPVWQLVLAKPF